MELEGLVKKEPTRRGGDFMKKLILSLPLAGILSLILATPVLAEAEGAEPTLGTPELLLELVILVFVGGILYNLWGTITSFGGLIGKSLKIIGIGIFLFSFEAIDKVLEHFQLDFVEKMLPDSGEEIFHDVLKIAGLFFLAWGLMQLTKIAKDAKG